MISLIDALISFESPTYVVPENGGPVEVCLMKSAPTAQGFTVQLEARQTQPTEATGKGWEEFFPYNVHKNIQQNMYISCFCGHAGGSDFVSGVVDVVFPAGTQNRSCANVPIIDDSEALEGVESFQLVIIQPNVPGVVVDDNPIAIVDIIDDDGTIYC